jgi:hypothetical protein
MGTFASSVSPTAVSRCCLSMTLNLGANLFRTGTCLQYPLRFLTLSYSDSENEAPTAVLSSDR